MEEKAIKVKEEWDRKVHNVGKDRKVELGWKFCGVCCVCCVIWEVALIIFIWISLDKI